MGRKRKEQLPIETPVVVKTPLEQLANLSPEKLAKLLSLVEQPLATEAPVLTDKPIEIAESDIVERKIKPKKGQVSQIFRGSAPVGQLAPLTGGVVIFTGKDDPAEKAFNQKRAKPKIIRPRYTTIKCDGCDYMGPENLFSASMNGKGKRLCNECVIKQTG